MLTRGDMKRIKEKGEEEDLQKQKEYLQSQCRKAGRAMIELNAKWEYTLEENKKLKKEVEELKADSARAKEDHQYDKMVHEKELKDLTKK